MADVTVLDKAFQVVLRGLIDTGHAPHYVELAQALGRSAEQSRAVVHELLLQPGTDYVAGFAPLTNVPTQYRIAIDGQPGWFGQ